MRTLLLVSLLAAVVSPLPIPALHAEDDLHTSYVKVKTSSPTNEICLNEVLRIEFTTMTRDVDDVDIATSVANSLRLGDGAEWRVLSGPTVNEWSKSWSRKEPKENKENKDSKDLKESGADGVKAPPTPTVRPGPVTVTFTVLPRRTGDLPMPEVPITWLKGSQVARLPAIKVDRMIKIGSLQQELPKEFLGVGGILWKAKFSEVKNQVPASAIQVIPGGSGMQIRLRPQLTLTFLNDALAGATLLAPQLSFNQARVDFIKRWGLPHVEDATSLTWYLGWTTITARPNTEVAGISLSLLREDLVANQAHERVSSEVFNVLDGPASETPPADKKPEDPSVLPPVGVPPLTPAPAVSQSVHDTPDAPVGPAPKP